MGLKKRTLEELNAKKLRDEEARERTRIKKEAEAKAYAEEKEAWLAKTKAFLSVWLALPFKPERFCEHATNNFRHISHGQILCIECRA